MTVFVIGGTGFIGQHITWLLVEAGHSVTLFHRGKTTSSLSDRLTTVHGDRDDPAALRSAIEAVEPDLVLDTIAYTEPQARALVDLASGRTGRLVVLSSGDVYRQYDGLRAQSEVGPDPVPLTEEAPLRSSRYPYRGTDTDFAYAYDYDKRLVEEQMRAGSVPATVLRLPKVYGPTDGHHHVGSYLDRLQSSDGPVVMGQQQARWRWSRGYVENVAAAVVRVVTSEGAVGRTYNLGEPDALPEATWMRRLASVAEIETTVEVVPDSQVKETGPFDWSYHMAMDTRRLRTELEFAEPVSHREGLIRTLTWERGTGDGRGTT